MTDQVAIDAANTEAALAVLSYLEAQGLGRPVLPMPVDIVDCWTQLQMATGMLLGALHEQWGLYVAQLPQMTWPAYVAAWVAAGRQTVAGGSVTPGVPA